MNKEEILEKLREKNLEILEILCSYASENDLAIAIGSEYISQDDSATIDAIDTICKIFDLFAEE